MSITLKGLDLPLLHKIAKSENPWDTACKFKIHRHPPIFAEEQPMLMEPGVTFFILLLEHLGCVTEFSCEGHPHGFYVAFHGPIEIADAIERCGWLSVERHNGKWVIRLNLKWQEGRIIHRAKQLDPDALAKKLEREKRRLLRNVALAWQKAFLQDLQKS